MADDRLQITAPTGLKETNAQLLAAQERGELPFTLPVLTVLGRRSQQPRSTPVTVLERAEGRFVLGGFPAADWIRNVRAAGGRATLTVGEVVEDVRLVELPADEAAPLLRLWPEFSPSGVELMVEAGVVRDATPDALAEVAGICPLFRLEPAA